MDKIENQKFIISRFDNYYDSVNNKGNFLITFQSLMIGGVIVGNRKLDDLISDAFWKHVFNSLSLVFVILAIISIAFILKAIFPYTKSGEVSNSYKSLIFYESINDCVDQDDYLTKINTVTTTSFLEDLIKQSYVLAGGLTSKFKNLSRAINFIYWEVLVLTIMIAIITFS